MSKLIPFCISLDPTVARRLRTLAAERRVPVSLLVREFVRRYYQIPMTSAEQLREIKRRERWARMVARWERRLSKKL
jgi:hypothetical protein